jgi:hypothetical protein
LSRKTAAFKTIILSQTVADRDDANAKYQLKGKCIYFIEHWIASDERTNTTGVEQFAVAIPGVNVK